MPGFLLHSGMSMTCPHGGKVTAVPAGPPAALVNGMPVLTSKDQLIVGGCTFTPPCAKVQWTNVSSLLADGSPVLTQTTPAGPGGGVCVGSGPPLVVSMQQLVTGR
ncbi:hypothetical protein [Amycolatopsis jejuensis]|uniref:hypothetical protein n=1 Tax=Amycolatopsis jejuensis TaxID=330084 RepID=UPI000525BAC9|nr:hypothetical protein [Amycolatopsis jejuensis]